MIDEIEQELPKAPSPSLGPTEAEMHEALLAMQFLVSRVMYPTNGEEVDLESDPECRAALTKVQACYPLFGGGRDEER